MVVVLVRNSDADSADLRPCSITKDPKSMLDDSHGTAVTVEWLGQSWPSHATPGKEQSAAASIDRDADAAAGEVRASRPTPIVINEDDALDVVNDGHSQVHVKETHFHTSIIKDSIAVQRHHNANDDEVHEENPHLEDFLIPHHEGHVEEKKTSEDTDRPRVVSTLKKASVEGKEPQDGSKKKTKVHFGHVLVRDYAMILGDHPCCSIGPPLTLSWDYLEYEPLDVNEYEFHHAPRRGLREMGLNYYQRKALLSNAGYTEVDFREIKKEVNRSKLNRSITKQIVSHPLPLMKLEDALESLVRKSRRLLKEDHWKSERSLFAK